MTDNALAGIRSLHKTTVDCGFDNYGNNFMKPIQHLFVCKDWFYTYRMPDGHCFLYFHVKITLVINHQKMPFNAGKHFLENNATH